MSLVPHQRITPLNNRAPNIAGEFVLYWMIANRRHDWNFALQRSVEMARTYKKPLLVFEALRCDYRWASDRIHQFVVDGMRANERAFARTAATYFPYIESRQGEGRGLLTELATKSVAIVTDDFPCFFLPHMVKSVGQRVAVPMEAVDANGIFPMRSTDREFSRAHYFRRHLQKELLAHLGSFPASNPLSGETLPPLGGLLAKIAKRWPAAKLVDWPHGNKKLQDLPIDHTVGEVSTEGGSAVAQVRLADFLDRKLEHYQDRNQPDCDVSSGLSPYLHFGHISPHQIVAAIMDREQWTPERLAKKPNGSARGWWGMNESAEAFLDELITWRELGYNNCCLRSDYDQFESLPEWAKQTLADHEQDRREHLYSSDEFAEAQTHDQLWNAAQRQLVREGRIHNYLRMLWGKKILEWTPTPQTALNVMVELNNRFALDGRNPNSYSGIFWVLGRYDRPWGPERPVYGKVRYMSSVNTARKVRVKDYLCRYAPPGTQLLF